MEKFGWVAVGGARAQPHSVTAALNERLAVEFRAASPPPGLDPLHVLLRHIRLGEALESRRDSWKWFEALWQCCREWQSDTCTFHCGWSSDGLHAANDITLQNLHCHIFGGAVVVPSSQWQADRSHSGIQVPLGVLIRLLGALCTLTYWGFISWPVVFLSESGSGMICILTCWCFSDGEVVFFLYEQINLTRAKGKKQKNGIWNSPGCCLVEPSCNAFCFPSIGAAAKLRITSGEEGQNETEMINFYWHTTSCCVSDNSISCGIWKQEQV